MVHAVLDGGTVLPTVHTKMISDTVSIHWKGLLDFVATHRWFHCSSIDGSTAIILTDLPNDLHKCYSLYELMRIPNASRNGEGV